MTTISKDLLSAYKLETGPRPVFSIIWMHGLGADGHDFVPIVNQLQLRKNTHVRFIFPHAPVRSVTINNGLSMRAWYDIYSHDLNQREDEAGIHDSSQEIDKLIDHEISSGIKSENIILAGFSQGGAMALYCGLRQKNRLAGIVALSCYLPLGKTLLKEIQPANLSLSIFMAHGNDDLVVPVALANVSKELLLDSGCKVQWHEYSMAHMVCADEITDIGNWINRTVEKSLI